MTSKKKKKKKKKIKEKKRRRRRASKDLSLDSRDTIREGNRVTRRTLALLEDKRRQGKKKEETAEGREGRAEQWE